MAFNSTIITKKKVCRICNREAYIFSRGRCKSCATIEDTKKRMEEEQERTNALEKWFDDRKAELILKPYCEETGDWIMPNDYRNCSAHILPKRFFHSVETHPWNKVFLSVRNGSHSKYDNTWEQAEQMKVWNEVVIPRFKMFMHEIDKGEIWRLPDSLKQILENPST